MELEPTNLPIEEVIEELRGALAIIGHAVLVAEPGAGKTTVVPLRLLDEPWLGDQRIVVLEPRRVAARAAARRMASLLSEEPGQTVGWTTRDDRRVGPRTRIEVVTEGVLTARLVSDPSLAGVGIVIFDEFHERSLPADTGLALALHSRREHGLTARLLVMSATLDDDAVATLLGQGDDPAPIITSTGRTHPVEIRWRPRKARAPLVPAVVRAVREGLKGPGDLLVFLPGVGEIRRTEKALHAEFGNLGPAVLPLHGSLPASEQDAALLPRSQRRIVLATDLAETSLTVEGIGVVIDSGLARVPRHDLRTTMTALHTVSISRASADQRAGRAGRTGAGIAIRLWSKVEHGSRLPYLPAAITEVELSDLVLDLARRGLTDPSRVPFLDAPPDANWAAAVALLQSLDALDESGHATALGHEMAGVGAHPRLAKMVVASAHPWLACLLTALVEDRDVLRGRPDELPADMAERLTLVLDPERHHRNADGQLLRNVRNRAQRLARSRGIEQVPVDPKDIGATLLAGFGDRMARAVQGVSGRFVLADGRNASIRRNDALASGRGLVVVDLGGRPKHPRINRAALLEATIDHLVYATPDLEATVAEIIESWGVTPTEGGRHDGRGTRNALLALGGGTYLEVIGPDLDQPEPPAPRPFGIDELAEPALVAWAAGVPDLDLWIAWARRRGVDPGEAAAMTRTTPAGETLRWRLTPPPTKNDGDGVLPFLIEWPGTTPAESAAEGVTLMSFVLRHPSTTLASRLAEYGVAVTVEPGPASVTATLLTPNGVVELCSTRAAE